MSTMSDIVWRAIHHSSAGGMISPPMLCLQMHRRALRYKLSRRCLAWALIKLRLYLAWLVVFALCVIRFYFCIYCCITIKECVCVCVCACACACVYACARRACAIIVYSWVAAEKTDFKSVCSHFTCRMFAQHLWGISFISIIPPGEQNRISTEVHNN